MSGYWFRLRAPLAGVAALVPPFVAALALVPFRTDLSATNEALIMVVVVVAVAALGTRAAGRAGRAGRDRPGHGGPASPGLMPCGRPAPSGWR
ncbi:hypothetical protein GCM10010425_79700 [Streptomyces spororaveus]|uniref:Uncharacterized protein n=1 Tax=Streptomyces spororaveus TaxID=284039 RepID=A0ABQ3T5M7_9ACTN|nr:hypothetical protein Sspor_12550 [Streptomyces spororaveus]